VPDLRAHTLDEKKLTIQVIVGSGLWVIQERCDLFMEGKITEQEAQRLCGIAKQRGPQRIN
jgi:hypothetical protein